MQILILALLLTITRNSRRSSTKVSLRAVLDTLTPVFQLALGLLLLAGGVLINASLAQALIADCVADGFFGGADGLVPGAVSACRGVLGDRAGVGVGG